MAGIKLNGWNITWKIKYEIKFYDIKKELSKESS